MKKRLVSLALAFALLVGLLPSVTLPAAAATAPTKLWIEATDTNGLPIRIDVFAHDVPTRVNSWGNVSASTKCYEIYLPGNAVVENCKLSWDGDTQARVGNTDYTSGTCPIPAPTTNYSSVTGTSYAFRSGPSTLATLNLVTYQGSADIQPIFINIDETQGTIAAMDGDSAHETSCVGQIWINGSWIEMPSIKGRGNYTWSQAQDKKAYNIKLDSKIQFPGIDSAKTKKWSILAEISDHSLMCNRSGFALAHELGVGQDTASADVWMNGEYQGCYTVTPKYDSFVTDDGYLIEEDNYLETVSVADGGDPQFELTGMHGGGNDSSHYNLITVKGIGDNLLGEGGETPENIQAAADNIHSWLQDAWDAMRSGTGYNTKGKHYSDYIDMESFAKMYLMQEYVKSYDVCAGSILFHRDGQTEADKLIAGPLWDLDNAMGSTQSNSGLGTVADRKSGKGAFISEINEDSYKTSLYKTLYQHEDFQLEVARQYNKNYELFNGLSSVIQTMTDEIDASAKMNHRKVNRIGYNLHQYANATTLENGTEYAQSMLKTAGDAVSSLSDWANYAANLKTYAAARSLWFYNTYYDPDNPALCEHEFVTEITEPTCTAQGNITRTCPKCHTVETEIIPALGHDLDDGTGVCSRCGYEAYKASFVCSEGCSVTVYRTKDLTTGGTPDATASFPRSGDDGSIDVSGDGQVNFVINLEEGYRIKSVVAAPAASFKNLKLPAETGVENGYRLTKVKNAVTITVVATDEPCDHEFDENGVCIHCGIEAPKVVFACGEGASVTAYPTQDLTTGGTPDTTVALARDSATGEVDLSGSGQVNFVVNLEDGYEVVDVSAAGAFKNLKGPADTGVKNGYRATKVSGAATVTITTNFVGYTVSLAASGRPQGSLMGMPGDTVTLPEMIDFNPVGWTFIGWMDHQIDETTTAPTFYAPGASYTVGTGSTTLYALYSREEAGPVVYELLTAAPADWAGNYVITNNTTNTGSMYVLKGVAGSANGTNVENSNNCSTFAASGITLNGNTMSSVANDYVITLAANGSDYTVKSAAAGCYYGMNSSSYLCAYSSINSTYCNWTPGINRNGLAQLKNTANGSYPYFSWNSSNHYFWSGRANNANVLKLYKEKNTSVTYYRTNPVDPPDPVDVYFVDQDGNTAAYVLASGSVIENASFPGEVMTAVGVDENGHNYYKVTLDRSIYTNVVFSGGSDATSTGDLGLGTGAQIIYCVNNNTGSVGDDIWPAPATVVEPTCTAVGTTTYKGMFTGVTHVTETDALGHDFGEWTMTTEPTCTAAGEETRYCSRCDATETQLVEVLGHAYDAVVTAPTCTEDGYTTHTCSRCGDAYTDAPMEALGHEWGEWAITTVPTCTAAGEETRYCSRCDATETQLVEVLGHAYDAVVTAPTCTEDGYTTHTCSRCGDAYTDAPVEALGHEWGEWAVTMAPTCTATGVETRICRRCDAEETREVAANGHTAGEAVEENRIEPTCTKTGSYDEVVYCTVCNAELSREPKEIAALGHDLVYHEAKAPTCTEIGWEAYDTCSRCDYTTYEELAALGHDYVAVVTEPTCTAGGFTTHTCSRCADAYTDTPVDALGHEWGEWAVTTVPTCTATGVETRICERCDAEETRELAANGHTAGEAVEENRIEPTCTKTGSYDEVVYCTVCRAELSRETKEIAALGHDLVNHEAQAPTCTEIGWNAYDTCSRCDYTTYVEKAALGHDLEHHEAQAPTCTEIGWEAYDTCSRCDYTTYVEKAALGHNLEHHEAKAPTCTEIGWNAYDTCSRCDYTTYEELAALGHAYDAVVTAPTCTEDGYTTHTCSRCGDAYTDAPVEALGHEWGEWAVTTVPTCTATGVETRICGRCDAEETREVAANGHTAGEAVEENRIEPTCTEKGSYDSVVYCSVCDAELSREAKEIDALGHNLVNHEAKAPTCTEKGWNAYQTCSRCDYTTYAELPATGHTAAAAVVENRIEPTCTKTGSYDEVVYCSVCEAELSREAKEINALGHDLIDHEAKAPTCTEIGWDAYDTCSRCDYTTYAELPATGHTPGAAVKENEVAPTCTEKGSYDEVVYCSVCDAELSRETKEIAALGHDIINHAAKIPTCTEIGWNAYDTCSRCDYTTYAELPATGHTPGAAVKENENAPTCTETGSYDEVVYCTVCHAELSRETKEIAELGHALVNHEAQAPTCTEKGWNAYDTCSRCDYTTYVELPATGHTPGAAVKENEVAPTCTEKGGYDEVVYCTVCNAELSRETKEIAALGHDLVYHEAKASTCTEIGWDAYDTCSRCDYTTYVEKAALGHDLVNHEAKAPTCTEIGWDEYQTCRRCDYTTYVEKAALGHDLVNHVAKAPTCTEIGWDAYDTCKRCDYTTYAEKAALGHDLVNHEAKAPTCTAIGWDAYDTCSRCDYTTYAEKAALGHDLVNHVAKAPTCTEIGWDAYDTCSRCDYTTYVEKAALGHDLVNHEAKAPTCTEIGWEAYDTCSRCDYTTYVEKAALGHDLVNHEAKAPTCTEIGWNAYQTCSRCDYTTYVELPANGHTAATAVIENRIEPTCTKTGSYDEVVYCTICNAELSRESKEIAALGHDLVYHEAQAPTCTEKGWNAYDTCSRCDYTTYAEKAALGHDLEHHEAQAPTCTEIGWDAYDTCSRCDYTTYVEKAALGHDLVNHEAKTPTCTEIGWDAYDTCSRCDYTTYAELPATGHTAGEAVEENRIEPTCTEKGSYDEVAYCTVCNAELSRESKEIDALGHDLVNHEAQAPTCTEKGWNAYDTCSRCGYTTYAELPATGHTPGAAVKENEVAPTCTEKGSYDSVVYCSVCDAELSRETKEIAALGHALVNHEAQAPTCTEKGWNAYDTCSRCDYTTYVEKAALGHALVNHEAKAPTCTEIGWDAYDTCSRCDYTTYAEKAALGHNLEHHEAKAPTCTEIGWDAYDTCSRCDYTTYAELPATGHTPGAAVKENEVAPTCTEKGSYDSVVYCSVCDAELSREPKEIAALGHALVNHAAKAPTCTEIGWDEYQTCSRCDYTTYAEKAALGHDLVNHEAKAPTCTEIGWEAYDTCKRCDYTTYVELPATGHTAGDAVEENRIEPTCTEKGSYDEVVYCTVCHAELSRETKEIAELGHALVNHEAKAPTCTEIGWDEYQTCRRCDYTTYAEKAALGHDLVHHGAKAPTCTEIGWDAYDTCSRCDYTTYVEKAALGHALVNHEAKAPTCTEIGWNTYDTCSRCDYTTYVELPATGHTSSAAVKENEVAPTCTEKGSYDEVVYCTVCNAELSRTAKEIAALGHALVNHAAKAPTCTEIGWDAYETCSRCDYTTYVEKAALGHNLEHHEAQAPTCTEIGWDAYDTCSRCDYTTYAEKAALGHDLEHHEAQAPTCTEIGWDAYDTCSRCDYTTYVEKAALGHDLVSHEAKAPTCTEIGWDTYDTCSRCDYTTYVEKTALGHDQVNHEAKAPTCTEIGWDAYDTCSRCDYTTYVEKAALGHDLVNHEAKAPTCTEIGWDEYQTCSRCDYTTYVEKTALGHDLVNHEAKAPTCTEIGWDAYDTCSRCDYTTYVEKAALGHDLVNHVAKAPTCTAIGWDAYDTCSRCDYTTYVEKAALGHDLVSHEAKAPTCTEIGWDAYDTCSRCDYTTYAEKAALGHDLVNHVAKAPTCTEIGWEAYDTCSRCDYTTYVEKAVLGHALVNHEAKAPTCTAIGWDAYDTCSRCDYTTYAEKAALGHDLVNHEAKAPTCTEIGWDAYDTCSRCDYTTYAEKAALGHDLVNHVAKAPTCTEKGWNAYQTCSRCDYTTYEELAALGHDYAAAVIENRIEPTCTKTGSYDEVVYCTVCHAELSRTAKEIAALGHALVNHAAKAPTCTEIGWDAYDTCSRCDYTTYVEKATLGHDLVSHEAQAPTCTEIGWDAYDTCSRCDYTTYVELPATGHTPGTAVKENEVAPTCTEKGSYDEVVYCTVCHAELSREPKEIAALGHDLVNHEAKVPTCTEKGWNAYDTCSRCDYTTYEELAALGHDYAAVVTEPTCTAGGFTTHTCSRCGDAYTDTPVDALGHEWGEWAVTTAPTCTATGVETRICGRCDAEETREVAALGHDLVNHEAKTPTCTEIGWNAYDTCSRCDYTTYVEKAALGHDLVNHEAKAPTCTEIGWDEYQTCSRCDYTTYAEKAALGHDLEHHEAQAPTCTEIGWDAYDTCSRCDYTTYVEKAALGHDLVNHVAKAPTCTEIGWDAYDTCSRCDYTTYVEKAALGHDLVSNEAKAPTCTEKGWNAYDTCSRCGYTTYEELAALGHDYVAVVTVPTCTAGGFTTHTCSRCADAYTDSVVEALGHEWGDWAVTTAPTCTATGVETRICERCDAEETREVAALGHDLVNHEAKAPTCTEKGWNAYDTCSRCDYTTYAELPATGHTAGAAVKENEVAPTCTEKGSYDEVVYCTVCHAELSREAKEIDALGHDLVNHEAKAPTCTEKGWNAYQTCSRCDYTTYAELPATGHTAGEAVEENRIEPTCTEKGSYDEVVYCTVCHAELSREPKEIAALGHDLVNHEAKVPTCTEKGWNAYDTCSRCDYTTYEELAALGHDYVAVVTEPTCTTAGFTTHTCSRCGDAYTDTPVEALGHEWGEWAVTTAPTCTATGVETRICERCEAEETREVAALGHDLVSHEAQAPTCTAIGWNAYQTCSRCGYTTYAELPAIGHTAATAVIENRIEPTCTEKGGYDEVVYCTVCHAELSREAKEIAALGHALVNHEAKAPTCTEKGWNAYQTCSRCDYTTYVELPATGHTPGAAVKENEVAPTCTEKGSYDEVAYCTVCNAELSRESKEIAALGHDLVNHEAKAPSCTEIGWEAYDTCKRCDYTTYAELPATGHTAGDAVEENRIEPTCTKIGSYDEVVYCTVCNTELSRETKEIAALGHDYVAVVTEPTCTTAGFTTHTCSRCGDAYTDTPVEALGHEWGEWAVTTAPTCTATGVETRICERCEAEETREVAALGHDLVNHEAKAPTCTEKGWNAYDTCSRCGYTTYAELPATGHTAAAAVIENRIEPTCTKTGSYDEVVYCTVCSAELSRESKEIAALGHALVNHAAKAPTCTEIGWDAYDTCSRCDYTTYAELPANGHTPGAAVKENEVAPTCTEKGSYDEVVYCTVCHAELSRETKEIAELGHALVNHEAKAPTCTEKGWNAYQTCSRCGYTTYVELPATGHTAGAAVKENEVAPTCTEKGKYDEVMYCTVCNAELSREPKEIAALGHALVNHAAKAPTCTEKGWNAYQTCSRCDYTTYEELAALGHDYVAVVTEPTCTAGGFTTHTCSRCADAYTDTPVEALGHEWGEWAVTTVPTCTATGVETRICERCDAEETREVAALGHDLVSHEAQAPTCTAIGWNAYQTCSRCDYTTYAELPATGHTPGEAVKENEVAPTCTEKGSYDEVVYCSVCEAELSREAKEINALGHDYVAVVTEPTCTTAGFTTHTCSRCGDAYTDTPVEALGHEWGDWAVTMAPTCTATGVETRICGRCDAEETREVAALGHDLVNHVAKAPTCTEIGWDAYDTCSRCDYTTYVEKAALGHDLVSHEAKAPTCTEKGWNAYDTCSRCDYTTYVELPATGHTPGAAVKENEVAPTCTEKGDYDEVVYCTVCNAELNREPKEIAALGHDLVNHEAKAPTCTEKGWNAYDTCSRCDYTTYVELPATGHTPGAAVKENEVAPTCTEKGDYDEVVYCTVCNAELNREPKEIAALGHDLVNHEAKAPTCTEKGWNAYQTCSRCDYTTYVELPATGHTAGDAVEENRIEPTCTEKGSYDEVVYCTVCHAELSRETKEIAALGHDYVAVVTEPTCTTAGFTTHTCSRCADAYTDSVVDALGHEWGEWAVTTEPTCTATGVETRICERCEAEETREGAALGHDLVNHEAQAPTCTEIGWDAYDTCSRCDYTTYAEKAALGHDLVNHVAKAPTCTEIGWDAYDTCSRCDYTTYAELPATGHTPGAAVKENEVAPTCTEKGSYDEVVYCTVCNAELSREAKEIDALGHDLVNHEAQAPTCTEKGWNAYQTCSRCGYTTYVELPATGHTAAAAVIENRIEPTCTKTGSYDEVVYCTVCSAELSRESKEIAALGHALVNHAAKAPTCTEIGWDAYDTCSRCDYTTYAEIAALGHDFAEGICSRCGEKDPDYVPAVDRSKLEEALSKAAAIQKEDYTAESVAVLEAAVSAAGDLADDADQTTVDAAAQAINAAIEALAAKPDETPFRFEDVKNEEAFFFDPVYWAYNADPQITKGISVTHFGPYEGCTRAQVVTFLWRAAGCPEPVNETTAFTDVDSRAFYARAVAWAVEQGITKGTTETTFAPDVTCTRGQIVTFLWRFKGNPAPASDESGFDDVEANAFYARAVAWAVEAGVTKGTTSTTFAPKDTCTRGQVVTFLYRAVAEKETNKEA